MSDKGLIWIRAVQEASSEAVCEFGGRVVQHFIREQLRVGESVGEQGVSPSRNGLLNAEPLELMDCR